MALSPATDFVPSIDRRYWDSQISWCNDIWRGCSAPTLPSQASSVTWDLAVSQNSSFPDSDSRSQVSFSTSLLHLEPYKIYPIRLPFDNP